MSNYFIIIEARAGPKRIGPLALGPRAGVIYSLLFKYIVTATQILQRTIGPSTPNASPGRGVTKRIWIIISLSYIHLKIRLTCVQ